jgi:hypothetical protein
MYLIFFKINWITYFRLKNKKSDHIIWLYQDYPKSMIKYIFGGYWVHDFSLVYAFIKLNKSFRLCIGGQLEQVSGKQIFYIISHRFNLLQEKDYTIPLVKKITQLEAQGNRLYPSAAEARYWENKIYMHEQFEALQIPQPKTGFITKNNAAAQAFTNRQFPLLIKEAHSCHSQGIYKVNNEAAAIEIIAKRQEEQVEDFLVQDLVDMHKDLRVILIGDEIVLHYWRINLADNWKPTSTSHGSMVDFVSFPEHWRSFIIESFKKLNLHTGAFDITFQHDDITNTPLFLEVSPGYEPNPRPTGRQATIPYYAYKKKLFTRNPYFAAAIDTKFDLRVKEIQHYFNCK